MSYVRGIAICLAGLVAGFAIESVAFSAEEPGDEMVKMVVGLLAEKDKDLRGVGLSQVRTEAKGAAATRAFAAQLPKLGPEAQVGLLGALADRGDTAARPAVLELLAATREDAVRVAAIAALGPLGEPADLPLLIRTLSKAAAAEQEAAKASLARLKGEQINAQIAAELKGASPAVRSALIEVLSTRRAFAIVPSLLPGLLDSDQAVRMSSVQAIAQLGGPEHLPALLKGVLKSEPGEEREAAEEAVVAVCNRGEKPEEAAATVLSAYAKHSAAEKLELISTLGRLGGPQVLAVIEAAATGGNAAERLAGLEAMGNWPDATIAEKLFTLAKSATSADERALAFQAYVRAAAMRGDERTDRQRLDGLAKAMSIAKSAEEKSLVIERCRAAYTVDTLRYVLPYVEQPEFSEVACETVVELAHHREVREPNKAEFDKALDKVLAKSTDPVVKDRAQRYKLGQTWVRPKNAPAKAAATEPAKTPAVETKAPPVAEVMGDDTPKTARPHSLSPTKLVFLILGAVLVLLFLWSLTQRRKPIPGGNR